MGKADTTASGTFQEQKGNESGSPINPRRRCDPYRDLSGGENTPES
jgi:hypothetical protein